MAEEQQQQQEQQEQQDEEANFDLSWDTLMSEENWLEMEEEFNNNFLAISSERALTGTADPVVKALLSWDDVAGVKDKSYNRVRMRRVVVGATIYAG